MQLPLSLRLAIEREADDIPTAELTEAAEQLSRSYRNPTAAANAIATARAGAAYAVVRMPATFAAVRAVLNELKRAVPDLQIESALDLGAGPGTVGWAAVETFAELRRIIFFEKNKDLIALGRRLARDAAEPVLRDAEWRRIDLTATDDFPSSDLVVCSYSLGEIELTNARRVFRAGVEAARKIFIAVEPGTPKNFQFIKTLRDEAIGAGWRIVAPCPHELACPMRGADWCHFAQRLERSARHRKIKKGELGYEDEKFSYLIIARDSAQRAPARVIARPQIQKSCVRLELCAADGELVSLNVTRKNREAWKRARKISWGDAW
jgi:ribosomal protein RSM22 (predicted rRNA methylase)